MNEQILSDLVRRLASAASCATALVLTMPLVSVAAPAVLECPSSISAKSVQLIDTPPGWQTFVSSPLYLHGAAPMSSPPEMLGELMHDMERRGKKAREYLYNIDGKFPNGKWLACTYGESDQMTLARRLPDDTSSCTVTYRQGRHVGQNDITVACN